MNKPFLFGSLTVLFLELLLVVSFRTLGWVETGSTGLWIASLVAAAIPLVVAGGLFIKGGRRFSLRALLIVIALASLFLFATVLPILEANRERSASRRLLAAGAEIETGLYFERFYEKLKFNPHRDRLSVETRRRELPPWLVPVAGKVLDIPEDAAIRSVSLTSDVHVHTLCESPSKLPNLNCISIGTGVSRGGMDVLRNALPKFKNVIELYVCDIDLSPDWLGSIATIESFWIVSERRPLTLSTEQLNAIAGLPNLKLLFINGYPVTDSDAAAFERTKTLRHIFFRRSAVTVAGKEQLELALPDCTVSF